MILCDIGTYTHRVILCYIGTYTHRVILCDIGTYIHRVILCDIGTSMHRVISRDVVSLQAFGDYDPSKVMTMTKKDVGVAAFCACKYQIILFVHAFCACMYQIKYQIMALTKKQVSDATSISCANCAAVCRFNQIKVLTKNRE